MARRAAAKPVDATQVASAEEQAKVDATQVASAEARIEAFERTRPDGVVVIVKRNIDTGEQTVTEK